MLCSGDDLIYYKKEFVSRWNMLYCDPNSVQEKDQFPTERSGGPSPGGLSRSAAEEEVAHRRSPNQGRVGSGGGGRSPSRYGTYTFD